jgi:hypothetical protein
MDDLDISRLEAQKKKKSKKEDSDDKDLVVQGQFKKGLTNRQILKEKKRQNIEIKAGTKSFLSSIVISTFFTSYS